MELGCNELLDRLLARGIEYGGNLGIPAKHAIFAIGILVVPLVGILAAWSVGEPLWIAPLAFLLSMLVYSRCVMPFKRRLIPNGRRQLLIDLTFIVAPIFFGATWILGADVRSTSDVFAIMIASGVAVFRMGCFFGGCCHGDPCRVGPQYTHTCDRVLPLPLFEAAFGLFLMMGLLTAAVIPDLPSGSLFQALAVSYPTYRLASEFWRSRAGAGAVRRWRGLTPTQWLAIAIVGSVAIQL